VRVGPTGGWTERTRRQGSAETRALCRPAPSLALRSQPEPAMHAHPSTDLRSLPASASPPLNFLLELRLSHSHSSCSLPPSSSNETHPFLLFVCPSQSKLEFYENEEAVLSSSAKYHENPVKRYFGARARGHPTWGVFDNECGGH
jgi:hypothetical protein